MSNLETNTVLKALAAQGWKLSQTSARGYKAVPPDAGKDIVYFAGRDESRSGTRAWKNSLKALRRSGFEWPQPAAERQQTNGAGDDQVDEARGAGADR